MREIWIRHYDGFNHFFTDREGFHEVIDVTDAEIAAAVKANRVICEN